MNIPQDHLLRDTEVADYLGVTRKTLENWRFSGKGPEYLKLGHKVVRYHPETLETWLAKRKRTSTRNRSMR